MNWTQSSHCRSRAHCRTCTTDPAWRQNVGAPDPCPFGITADNLPIRGAFRVRVKKKGCGSCPPVEVTFYAEQ